MYNYDRNIEDVFCAMEMNHAYVFKDRIQKIYIFARDKHKGQTRKSGEAYIKHPLRVAFLVASWGMETDYICAALLHDVVEDCKVTLNELKEVATDHVVELVNCLTTVDAFMSEIEKKKIPKEELDKMSDAFLVSNVTRGALIIKIADRLDNLNTIDCFPAKNKIKKTLNTHEIIIELAKRSKAFYLVDELETQCLRVENFPRYDSISKRYETLLEQNKTSVEIFKKQCAKLFRDITVMNKLGITNDYSMDPKSIEILSCIKQYEIANRTVSSINRNLINNNHAYVNNLNNAITRDNTPLLDISIVVDDHLLKKLTEETNKEISLWDYFYIIYDKYMLPNGVRIIKTGETIYRDSSYIIIQDMMNNLYRVFVYSVIDFTRYKLGDIVETLDRFNIEGVDKDDTDPNADRIKVYRRNGSEMYILKGATVLDFAFAIHSEIGLSFNYATIDGNDVQHGMETPLQEGNKVEIHQSPDVKPSISWFKHVKTRKAVKKLVEYFTPKEKIKVVSNEGVEIMIKNGATVLDYAFVLGTDIGLHFDYAIIEGSSEHQNRDTILKNGDLITIVTSNQIAPKIDWFKSVKTKESIDKLVEYYKNQ